MKIQCAKNPVRKLFWSRKRAGSLVLVLMATLLFLGSNPALAQELDRVRCKIDALVDDFGIPFNHVQIQVKVDTELSLPVDIWVTNEFGTASSVATGFASGGTVTGEWDSSPDTITPEVLLIDPAFADVGENVTASFLIGGVPGAATMTVACRAKVGGVFRQDTKPCKQKDFDRGRCSPVTEP